MTIISVGKWPIDLKEVSISTGLWQLWAMNHERKWSNRRVCFFSYIGDRQMNKACQTFVETYGERMVRDSLCRNFTVHLCNLYDFGLIKGETVHRTVMLLFKLRDQMEGVATSGTPATRGRPSTISSLALTSASGSAFSSNKRAFAGIHSSQDSHNTRFSNGSNSSIISFPQGNQSHLTAASAAT